MTLEEQKLELERIAILSSVMFCPLPKKDIEQANKIYYSLIKEGHGSELNDIYFSIILAKIKKDTADDYFYHCQQNLIKYNDNIIGIGGTLGDTSQWKMCSEKERQERFKKNENN